MQNMTYNLQNDRAIRISGSKSILQRLLTMLCVSSAEILVKNWNDCRDVSEMCACLVQSGFSFSRLNHSEMMIKAPLGIANNAQYNIAYSATALRLWMVNRASNENIFSTIRSSKELCSRPHQPLIDVLNRMGAGVCYAKNSFRIRGAKLRGGQLSLPTNISSQYHTAIAINAPLWERDTLLEISSEQVSAAYLDLTLKMMARMGAGLDRYAKGVLINSGTAYTFPKEIFVEPDWSSIATLLVWGSIPGHKLSILVNYESSLHPDRGIVDILRELGAILHVDDTSVSIVGDRLKGGFFDCSNNPDLVPNLAILGIYCEAKLSLAGIDHLRHKESNRIDAIIKALIQLGVTYHYDSGTLDIFPCRAVNAHGVLNTYNDHRMAMAFVLLKQIIPQLKISETSSIQKSFPEFFTIMTQLTSS